MSEVFHDGPFTKRSPRLAQLRTIIWRLRYTSLQFKSGGKLRATEPPAIGPRCSLRPPNEIEFSARNSLGREVHCEVDLKLGTDVLISSRVAFVGRDHPVDGLYTVYAAPRPQGASVTLEGDNLVGFGAIIIAPARLAKGAVVASGAVVTGDVPADCIVAGIPAKPLRYRRRE